MGFHFFVVKKISILLDFEVIGYQLVRIYMKFRVKALSFERLKEIFLTIFFESAVLGSELKERVQL